jgi:hypothetical protein
MHRKPLLHEPRPLYTAQPAVEKEWAKRQPVRGDARQILDEPLQGLAVDRVRKSATWEGNVERHAGGVLQGCCY